MNDFHEEHMRKRAAQLIEENERLKRRLSRCIIVLELWMKFWHAENDDIWLGDEASHDTQELLEECKDLTNRS